MLIFSTKIPVKKEITESDFIKLCADWVYGSPHYHQIKVEYDINEHKKYEISKENIKCSISCFKNESVCITAFRLINDDHGTIWTIELLFINENGNQYISVQNNCDSTTYDPRFPKNHKPNFIKKIMENNYGLEDTYFPVCDRPILCNNSNVGRYADYINGKINLPLPMIYISKDFDNYSVDYNKLARWLSGMAYVVVEEDKNTSFKLKELTCSKNAHNGYLGIYYPSSSNYQLYSAADFRSGEFESKIAVILQQSLINHLSSNEYNWLKIELLKAKEKIWQNQDISDELNEFIQMAEETEKDLKSKIELLQKTNDSLSSQLESLKAKSNDNGIIIKTGLTDFYVDEQHDFVIYIMNELAKHVGVLEPKKYRQHEILQNLIDNNKVNGENDRIIEEIKKIFKSGFKWNTSTKNRIKALGFDIQEGSHNKIIFHDSKYMYTVASTPSDGRGIINLLKEIEKGISISRKII